MKVQEKVQEELAKELAAEAEKLRFNGLAHYLAVVNADNRLKHLEDLDFAVAAIADFDNGLTIGFMDGADVYYQQGPQMAERERPLLRFGLHRHTR